MIIHQNNDPALSASFMFYCIYRTMSLLAIPNDVDVLDEIDEWCEEQFCDRQEIDGMDLPRAARWGVRRSERLQYCSWYFRDATDACLFKMKWV